MLIYIHCYFQDQNATEPTGKRSSEIPFDSLPSKKKRFDHSTSENPFKLPKKRYKTSRLKLVSSLQSLQDNDLMKNRKLSSPSSTTNSESNNLKNDFKETKNTKQKVSFNSEIMIHPITEDAHRNLDKLNNKKTVDGSKTVENSNINLSKKSKKPIASLFTKNPDIPTLTTKEIKSDIKEDLFSALTFDKLDIAPKLVSTCLLFFKYKF